MIHLKKGLSNLLFHGILIASACSLTAQDASNVLAWETSERTIATNEGLEIQPGVIEYKNIKLSAKNTTDEPITINDVISDCTCLKITKSTGELAPQDTWGFTVGLISPKYGGERLITVSIDTDKGVDILKLKFLAKEFVKIPSDNLYWGEGDLDPKRIDLELGAKDIEISNLRVLGDGYTAELIKNESGGYTIKITPIKQGSQKGLLKFKAANSENIEERTVRLNKATN